MSLSGLVFASGLEILHEFDGLNGREPYGSVAPGPDGWLYGTTVRGGTEGNASMGTLFKCLPDGNGYQVLRYFEADTNGSSPFNGLAFGQDWIYGTTRAGGEFNRGTIYRIGYSGAGYEVLHDFRPGTDGRWPTTSPTLVGQTLVGMTLSGGANNEGVVYRLDAESGDYEVIHSFAVGQGTKPFGTVTPVGDWLYGMTSDHLSESEHGNIFRLRSDGSDYEVLHAFEGGALGGYPYDSLIFDGVSRMYGTTLGYYTDLQDEGVVFSYDLDTFTFSVLHDFGAQQGDGAKPNGGVVLSPDGLWVYGVVHGTEIWGGEEQGTLFRMAPDGSQYEVLHTFSGGMEGDTPMRTPVLEDGVLIGTTAYGGPEQEELPRGYGTIWAHPVPEPAPMTLLALAAGCQLAVRSLTRKPRKTERNK